MEGFQELAHGGGVSDIVWPLTGVLVFAAVSGAIAWTRSKRLVAR
jgi:hypothetical protein